MQRDICSKSARYQGSPCRLIKQMCHCIVILQSRVTVYAGSSWQLKVMHFKRRARLALPWLSHMLYVTCVNEPGSVTFGCVWSGLSLHGNSTRLNPCTAFPLMFAYNAQHVLFYSIQTCTGSNVRLRCCRIS